MIHIPYTYNDLNFLSVTVIHLYVDNVGKEIEHAVATGEICISKT